MDGPHCKNKFTRKRNQKTQLGYDQYHCCDCNKQFNERTGTPQRWTFNGMDDGVQ